MGSLRAERDLSESQPVRYERGVSEYECSGRSGEGFSEVFLVRRTLILSDWGGPLSFLLWLLSTSNLQYAMGGHVTPRPIHGCEEL